MNVSRGSTDATTRGSPKPHTNTQQRVEEVLRRKAAAERIVAERREAIKKEQLEKFAKLDAYRDAEKRDRAKKNAEKELLRQKEALDRRQQQLEANEKKKEAILAKAHAVASRTSANNKKSFAFGSSTPRELAYLQHLSKESKVYDKKIEKEPEHSSPVARPARRSVMTTSMYESPPREMGGGGGTPKRVASAARPQRNTHNTTTTKGNGGLTASAPAQNRNMTQSMYVPSSAPRPLRVPRAPTDTPSRPPPAPRNHSPHHTNSSAPTASTRKPPVAPQSTPARQTPTAVKRRSVESRGGGGAVRVVPPQRPTQPLLAESSEEVAAAVAVDVGGVTALHPPAPPSEDSDAGFSEGSFERAGSEKSSPVHTIVEHTAHGDDTLTPREERVTFEVAAAKEEEKEGEQHVEKEETKEEEAVNDVKELVYSEDVTHTHPEEKVTVAVPEEELPTPIVEAPPHHINVSVVEAFDKDTVAEQAEQKDDKHTVEEEEEKDVQSTGRSLADELAAVHGTVEEEKKIGSVPTDLLLDLASEEEHHAPSPATVPAHVPTVPEGDLLGGFSPVLQEEKTITVEELPTLTPATASNTNDVATVEEAFAPKQNGVSSHAAEEEEKSTSPLPSLHSTVVETVTSSGGPSSSSSSEAGSPETRRRILEEKKAEMMRQSTILAMADAAAKERDERKARLAAIMNRTRAGGAPGSASSLTTSTTSSMTTSMTTSTSTPDAASVLAKVAHITSNPRIMQAAERSGSQSDLHMDQLPGAVQFS